MRNVKGHNPRQWLLYFAGYVKLEFEDFHSHFPSFASPFIVKHSMHTTNFCILCQNTSEPNKSISLPSTYPLNHTFIFLFGVFQNPTKTESFAIGRKALTKIVEEFPSFLVTKTMMICTRLC